MLFNERTCSHCLRTFKPRAFGINLLVKRYEICPSCHRLTEVPFAPPAAAEALKEEHGAPLSEEEALRKRLNDSKYEEM